MSEEATCSRWRSYKMGEPLSASISEWSHGVETPVDHMGSVIWGRKQETFVLLSQWDFEVICYCGIIYTILANRFSTAPLLSLFLLLVSGFSSTQSSQLETTLSSFLLSPSPSSWFHRQCFVYVSSPFLWIRISILPDLSDFSLLSPATLHTLQSSLSKTQIWPQHALV